MLKCLPRCVSVASALPVVFPALDESGSMAAFSAVHTAFFEVPALPAGGRASDRRMLRGAEILHARFGVTDPDVFRALGNADLTCIVPGNNVCSSLPVIHSVEPSAGLAHGCIEVTQVSF